MIFGSPINRDVRLTSTGLSGLGERMNIYERFGVNPVINVSGTKTRFGGSLMEVPVINLGSLVSKGIVRKSEVIKRGVKILGQGEIEKKIIVENLEVSDSAKEKIIKAGGQVV